MAGGICLLSVIPCRAEANDRSEMVTQLLFGELVEIKSRKSPWIKIKSFEDGYQGWVDEKQITQVPEGEWKRLQKEEVHFLEELIAPLSSSDNQVQTIVIGSRLRGLDSSTNEFSINGITYKVEGHTRKETTDSSRSQIIEDAYAFLNVPYLWGGKSPLGIDCSGFTQLVYSLNGQSIPRDAGDQSEMGHALSFIEEAEEGDLAFFANEEGKIIHVGIMLQQNRIIHASGQIRIDRIDHQGIFREDLNDYSHKLRIIKKLI